MKRVLPFFAMLSMCAFSAHAQQTGQITTVLAAKALTNTEATQHTPVDFEATVTNYRSYERNLFVQDGDVGIYLHLTGLFNLVPGDRVRVRGTMRPSFK